MTTRMTDDDLDRVRELIAELERREHMKLGDWVNERPIDGRVAKHALSAMLAELTELRELCSGLSEGQMDMHQCLADAQQDEDVLRERVSELESELSDKCGALDFLREQNAELRAEVETLRPSEESQRWLAGYMADEDRLTVGQRVDGAVPELQRYLHEAGERTAKAFVALREEASEMQKLRATIASLDYQLEHSEWQRDELREELATVRAEIERMKTPEAVLEAAERIFAVATRGAAK